MDVNLTRFMILVVLLKTHHPRAFSLTVTNYRKAYIRIAQSTRHIIWRHLRIRLLTKEGKTFQLTLYSDQTNGGELGRCKTPCFGVAPSHQASQTIAGTRRGPLHCCTLRERRRRRSRTLPLAAEGVDY